MINSNWVRMAAWRESFGETSGDVETEISSRVGETRGVINCEFKREIGSEIAGETSGDVETKIGSCIGETRGVINYEFKREIGMEEIGRAHV